MIRFVFRGRMWMGAMVCAWAVVFSAAPARAIPIHFAWDSSVTGGFYQLMGPKDATGLPQGRQQKPMDVDLPEGGYRLIGSGFDTNFIIKNEAVSVQVRPGQGPQVGQGEQHVHLPYHQHPD